MSRWLVLDIGNTHTVAGLCEITGQREQKILSRVRFRTDPHATSDEYYAQLKQLLKEDSLWKSLERIIISNVVPSLERTVKQALHPIPCLLIKADTRREFELDLPFPDQLGADRLANVTGTLCLARPPFLIVDAGTATTFCLIDERPAHKAAYIGGAIVPGLEIGWKALQTRAAKLFSVELNRPSSSIGTTTETQLQSGVLLGYESLIEAMTDRLLEDWKKHHEVSLFATGGCLSLLKLSKRFRIEPDLTLLGLIRYGHLTQ